MAIGGRRLRSLTENVRDQISLVLRRISRKPPDRCRSHVYARRIANDRRKPLARYRDMGSALCERLLQLSDATYRDTTLMT